MPTLMMSLKDMLLIHFLIGVTICILFSVRANNRNYQRWVFYFGEGVFGQQKKWIQWYSWALMFEIVTSALYFHSTMFYAEIAWSFFEAAALTLGAFVIDRVADVLSGNVETNGKLNPDYLRNTVNKAASKAGAKLNEFSDSIKKSYTANMDQAKFDSNAAIEKAKAEHKKFEDLLKGN